jgi:hypothetical protein
MGESEKSGSFIIIRTLLIPDTAYLAVNPESLTVSLLPSSSIKFTPAAWSDLRTYFSATPYFRALTFATDSIDPVREAGVQRLCAGVEDGVELTCDLCPSHRPLDKQIFSDIAKKYGRAGCPVPVGIAITGRWIEHHPDEFCWLDSLERDSLLSIIWINHTMNHRARRFLPRSENHFLEKGAKMSAEILGTEKTLIEWGCMPSVFFRFPGLVADSSVFDSVLDYGLIPLSSDAWLAKGELPVEGSIVLVHANGNEPRGVKDILDLIDGKRRDPAGRRWNFLDLRRVVIDGSVPVADEDADTTEWWRSTPAGSGQILTNNATP